MEVEVEGIVGDGLRERAGAAGPLLRVVDLGRVGRVGGVVEVVAVGVGEPGGEDCVVEDALEVVAVRDELVRIAGGADKVAGELGGGVGAAGRLEVVGGGLERGVELAFLGGDKGFVGPQPPEANCCCVVRRVKAFWMAWWYFASPSVR